MTRLIWANLDSNCSEKPVTEEDSSDVGKELELEVEPVSIGDDAVSRLLQGKKSGGRLVEKAMASKNAPTMFEDPVVV
ncbi:MAG: hypothetical protein Q9212_005335 [Teloschistes hypoglaucus]